MKINNFRGDLSDISAKKEALMQTSWGDGGPAHKFVFVAAGTSNGPGGRPSRGPPRPGYAVWPIKNEMLSNTWSCVESPYDVRCWIRTKGYTRLGLVNTGASSFAWCRSGSCFKTLMKNLIAWMFSCRPVGVLLLMRTRVCYCCRMLTPDQYISFAGSRVP